MLKGTSHWNYLFELVFVCVMTVGLFEKCDKEEVRVLRFPFGGREGKVLEAEEKVLKNVSKLD